MKDMNISEINVEKMATHIVDQLKAYDSVHIQGGCKWYIVSEVSKMIECYFHDMEYIHELLDKEYRKSATDK